jgi:hypothetical protein
MPPEFLFIDDGYSGETLQRPSLESLRDRIAACLLPFYQPTCHATEKES